MAAMPSVEVRNAGLRTRPNTVPRSGVLFQRIELSAFRLLEKQTRIASRNPGAAAM